MKNHEYVWWMHVHYGLSCKCPRETSFKKNTLYWHWAIFILFSTNCTMNETENVLSIYFKMENNNSFHRNNCKSDWKFDEKSIFPWAKKMFHFFHLTFQWVFLYFFFKKIKSFLIDSFWNRYRRFNHITRWCFNSYSINVRSR